MILLCKYHKVVCIIACFWISFTQQCHNTTEQIHCTYMSKRYSNIFVKNIIKVERSYWNGFFVQQNLMKCITKIYCSSQGGALNFRHGVFKLEIWKTIWYTMLIYLSKVTTYSMTDNTVHSFLFDDNNICSMRRFAWSNYSLF